MTTKKEKYLELSENCEKIVSIEKSIESLERKIDKIDENSFDTLTASFIKSESSKMDKIREKIDSKETELKAVKERNKQLIKEIGKVEVIV